MNQQQETQPLPGSAQTPSAAEEAQMSETTRMINVVFSPGETFADINRKPTWVAPVIISLAFSLAAAFLFQSRVMTEETFEQITRQKLEEALEKQGVEPNEDVIQQRINVAKKFRQFWYLSTVVGIFFALLVIAGVYSLILLLLQAETKFKKVFSVVSWSWMARSVVLNLIGIITLLLRDPATIDPLRPERLAATNLAILLSPRETSPVLYSLASSFDVFDFWFLILLSIGFSQISKKVSVGKAAAGVFAVWIIYVLARMGLAALTG